MTFTFGYLLSAVTINMIKMNGTDLLTAYRKSRAEGAFTELVRRYANLVYSVAHRRLANGALAEEVAQTVFLRLAQATPKVSSDAALVAWLHRTTVHVAIDVWRSETRRRLREQHAAAMDASPSEDARLWSEMAPQLDEALNQLGDEDREVLLLRFFAQKRMREVGETLGVSEDAAKMRVRRALERLRGQLALRGVTCTVGLLAAFMAERAIEAAPGHLLPRLVALKFASAGGTGLAALLPGAKVGTALTVLLVAGVCLVALLSSPGDASRHSGTETVARAPLVSAAPTSRRLPARHTTPLSFHAADFRPDNVRLRLHVVDAETGAGLANAGSLQPIFTRVELESHTTLLRTRVAPWPFRNRTRAAITA